MPAAAQRNWSANCTACGSARWIASSCNWPAALRSNWACPTGWQIVDELDDQQLRLEAIRHVLAGGSTARTVGAAALCCSRAKRSRSVTAADRRHRRRAVRRVLRFAARSLARIAAAARATAGTSSSRRSSRWPPRRNRPTVAFAKAWQRRHRPRSPARLGEAFICDRPGQGPGRRRHLLSQTDRRGASRPVRAAAAARRGDFLVGQLIDRTEATYKLLAAYGEIYQRLKIAQHGLRFDDVPRLLSTGLADGLMQHTHWRLDTSIGHLLLDEFQDTSLPQWNVLKPFALACCDGDSGRSFFCVGDVKQAIYRWRGGVSQLFDAARSQLPGVGEQSLTKSYRSSPVVIDTVEPGVWQSAGERSTGRIPGSHRAMARLVRAALDGQDGIRRLYAHVRRTALAKGKSNAPHVGVRCRAALPSWRPQCPNRSIGVLVRRNRAVAELIYLLR